MLGRWDDGPNELSTKRLMFQVLFFLLFLLKFFAKMLSIFFFFYDITTKKIKSFECPKSIKNNPWNIRRLVKDSFVPSSKQPSVIYCRLTDFKSPLKVPRT